MLKFLEENPRSLSKMVSWRVLVSITNFIIGYAVSGSLKIGFDVAWMTLLVNSSMYFFHERFWNIVDWGKTTKPK